ncbi:hypothetical protein ABPH35_05670 [Streptococcus sp. ZJ93]
MTNILVVTGHTYPEISIGNQQILKKLQQQFPNSKVSDLMLFMEIMQ